MPKSLEKKKKEDKDAQLIRAINNGRPDLFPKLAVPGCQQYLSEKKRRSKFSPDRELSLEAFYPADKSAMAITMDLTSWATQPLEQVLDEELGNVIKNISIAFVCTAQGAV